MLERVWGYEYLGDSRLVDAHVRRLRVKVEEHPDDPKLIQLIRTDLPAVGNTQIFSTPWGIVSTFFIFVTMATGFPHNVARFLGMRKLSKKDYGLVSLMVVLVAGFPVFLNAITGLCSRAVFGKALLAPEFKPWFGDLAAQAINKQA